MSNEREVAQLIRRVARFNPDSATATDTARELIRLIKGTCIRDDCPKYDEAAPDNCSNAGICIYHESDRVVLSGPTDGHEVAIRACNEPCSNAECMNRGEGDKCLNHGLCEGHIPRDGDGAPGGYCKDSRKDCPAYNSGDGSCSSNFIDECDFSATASEPCDVPCAPPDDLPVCADLKDGLCQRGATCNQHIIPALPGAAEPVKRGMGAYPLYSDECTAPAGACAETCYRETCLQHGTGNRCSAACTCAFLMTSRAPYLLQGYTLEQWGEIYAGGYFCQFSEGINDGRQDWKKPVARLLEFGRKSGNGAAELVFISESGKEYRSCRPAELPGVLRPWFGGECPVDPATVVFIKLRDGSTNTRAASGLTWTCPLGSRDIIAFMEVK